MVSGWNSRRVSGPPASPSKLFKRRRKGVQHEAVGSVVQDSGADHEATLAQKVQVTPGGTLGHPEGFGQLGVTRSRSPRRQKTSQAQHALCRSHEASSLFRGCPSAAAWRRQTSRGRAAPGPGWVRPNDRQQSHARSRKAVEPSRPRGDRHGRDHCPGSVLPELVAPFRIDGADVQVALRRSAAPARPRCSARAAPPAPLRLRRSARAGPSCRARAMRSRSRAFAFSMGRSQCTRSGVNHPSHDRHCPKMGLRRRASRTCSLEWPRSRSSKRAPGPSTPRSRRAFWIRSTTGTPSFRRCLICCGPKALSYRALRAWATAGLVAMGRSGRGFCRRHAAVRGVHRRRPRTRSEFQSTASVPRPPAAETDASGGAGPEQPRTGRSCPMTVRSWRMRHGFSTS